MGNKCGAKHRETELDDALYNRIPARDARYAYYVAWNMAMNPRYVVFWKASELDVLYHNILDRREETPLTSILNMPVPERLAADHLLKDAQTQADAGLQQVFQEHVVLYLHFVGDGFIRNVSKSMYRIKISV